MTLSPELLALVDAYGNGAYQRGIAVENNGGFFYAGIEAAARSALIVHLEALAKDAARYRWLRANPVPIREIAASAIAHLLVNESDDPDVVTGQVFDLVIDAAMREG